MLYEKGYVNLIKAILVAFSMLLIFMTLFACTTVSSGDTAAGKAATKVDSGSQTATGRQANETGKDKRCDTISSEKNNFCISLKSNVMPVPLNRIHGWTLHLENSDGTPVDNAHIMVHGLMPAHRHGFPTSPQVTKNSNSKEYLIEGIKFSMHGKWQIWLTIRAGQIIDKAVFELEVS